MPSEPFPYQHIVSKYSEDRLAKFIRFQSRTRSLYNLWYLSESIAQQISQIGKKAGFSQNITICFFVGRCMWPHVLIIPTAGHVLSARLINLCEYYLYVLTFYMYTCCMIKNCSANFCDLHLTHIICIKLINLTHKFVAFQYICSIFFHR